MVLEQEIPSYSAWFPGALKHFGETAFFVVLGATAISYLVAAFRYGPLAAGDRLYREVLEWSTMQRPHQARESLFVALAGNPATAARRGLAEIAG